MKTLYKSLLVLFIFLLSCDKEEIQPELATVTLNKNAVEFLKVTSGKYLIYKDSATSENDSVIITKSELKNIFYPEFNSNNIFIPNIPAYNGEEFELIYTKKTDANESSIWFKGKANAFYKHNANLLNLPLKLVDYIGDSVWYAGAIYYDENTSIIPSFTVEGNTYSNVIIHKTFNGLEMNHPNYLRTEYFWAEGIGIIQKSIETTNGMRKTYYLIRRN
jgi:hypothetical protein